MIQHPFGQTLIGSTAWAATELKTERQSSPGRVGFVLLTMLQR